MRVVGRQRFKIKRILQEDPYMIAEVEYGVRDIDVPSPESSDELASDLSNMEREVHQIVVDIIALFNR